jgi:hypothetical protein
MILTAFKERIELMLQNAAEPMTAAGERSTVQVLKQCLAAEEALRVDDINHLAAKATVAKRMFDRYRADWKRGEGAAELPPRLRYALAGVVLCCAHQAAAQRIDRGLTLQWLNAAFACMEREVADWPTEDAAAMSSLASALLDDLCSID